MSNNIFCRAQKFVYRNARPIDLVLWKYHFEDGSKDDVLTALAAYQNPDGGFAYAIEPDCWNVVSTPIATWAAIGKIKQLDFVDKSHPIIQGILKYLDSGKDFVDGKWYNVVKSNNDYPHAVWWHCEHGEGETSDNPTVSLAGFVIQYADKDSNLYKRAVDIIKRSVNQFIDGASTEGHTLKCFMELYEYCESANAEFVNLSAFKSALCRAVLNTVCADSDKWMTEYVFKPSSFFDRSQLIFDIIDRGICEKEAALIEAAQQDDGAFPVTWLWYNDYKEFEISKNWWKSSIIINNLLFIKALKG